jgi:hypothetical protein
MFKRFSLLAFLLVVGLVFGVASTALTGIEPTGEDKIYGKSVDAIFSAVLVDPNCADDNCGINGDEYVVQYISFWWEGKYTVFGPKLIYVSAPISGYISPSGFPDICGVPSLECENPLLYSTIPEFTGPPGCWSKSGGETLIITKVRDFIKTTKVISAIISIQILVKGI